MHANLCMGIYGGRIILLLIMICRKEGKGSYNMLIFVMNFRSLSDNNLVQREKAEKKEYYSGAQPIPQSLKKIMSVEISPISEKW